MRRILITGSTGMLGSDFVRTLSKTKKYEIYGLSRRLNPNLSSRNQFQFRLEDPTPLTGLKFKPDVIIHTAALTNLNVCETNPDLAHQINVEGSGKIAQLAGKDTLFFYISTDSVFDGHKGDYKEIDQPNPLNVYALTKFRGEQRSKEENKGFTCIIRTNIYGFNIPAQNSLAEWAFQEWENGNSIFGFTDILFNAVFTHQLVAVIERLLQKDVIHPVLNVGSDRTISKYDFLNLFRKSLGGISDEKLKPTLSANFPSKVLRPKNTSLNTSLLATISPAIHFEDGLRMWRDHSNKLGFRK